MAFRREAFDRAGLWSNRVGRKKGTLLGQEVREWMLRAREAGLHNATFEQADATSYYAAASRPRFRSATNRR